ncbi:MAG: hypothetical protein ACTSQJ_03065 [Promethearchaeota archaeon]
MRYIEYQIVLGDAPPGMITDDIKKLATPETDEIIEPVPESDEWKDSLWREGVIHHLSKETYVWNFSLIYKAGNFDIIKWKTSFAWKSKEKEEEEDNKNWIMNKALFIGTVAGIFFIKIDDEIYDNFNRLADMMDIFIQKTEGDAPFLVYGIIKDKKAITELKTDKEMLKHLADVKKWTTQHGGEFRLENLAELKMNLTYLINDYSHFILTRLKTKTNYSNLKLGEVHFLDYNDLITLKEIETAFELEAKEGETVDSLLSKQLFELLKRPEFQEETYIAPIEPSIETKEIAEEQKEPKVPTSKIKIILEEIRRGIRRQCPKCFNNDRNKIFEILDKDNVIMQNPMIYGFKYRCGMCGNEWKTRKDWKIEEL